MTKKKEKAASESEGAREAFQHRLEVQLEEWSAEIDHMRAEAERKELDEQMRRKVYERAQELRDRVSETAEKLKELKRSGEKSWRTLKKDLERTWDDIKEAFDRA